jgi:hypothetical protein
MKLLDECLYRTELTETRKGRPHELGRELDASSEII